MYTTARAELFYRGLFRMCKIMTDKLITAKRMFIQRSKPSADLYCILYIAVKWLTLRNACTLAILCDIALQ